MALKISPQMIVGDYVKRAAKRITLATGALFGGLALIFLKLGAAAFKGFLIGAGVGGTAGAVTGAILGAKIGAAIGTLIFPGVGTVVGGVIGGALGATIGFFTGASIGGIAGGLTAYGLTTGSLTTSTTGLGMAAGTTIGFALGGPLGAFAGAIIGAALGYFIGHYVIGTIGLPASGALAGAAIGFYIGGLPGAAIGASIGWLATGGWAQARNFFVGTAGTTTTAAAGFFGFVSGVASTIWNGLTSAAANVFGFLSHGFEAAIGGLSKIAIPSTAVAYTVGGTVGGITIGSTLMGIITSTAFFSQSTDGKSGGEGIPPPPESEFVSVQKLVSAPALSLGPNTVIQFTNSVLPQILTYDINIKALTKITGITCSDQITLTRNDGTTENISVPPLTPCPIELNSGKDFFLSFGINAPNESKYYDSNITNRFLLNGSGETVSSTEYYILLRNDFFDLARAQSVKDFALTNYPNNLINADCFGQSCWDYVINQSRAANTNPTFVLAIWFEESHFSDVGNHFSCPYNVPRTHDATGLAGSLDCFLTIIIDARPNTSDGFIDAMNQYCGTGPWSPDPKNPLPLCSNNPNFLKNLKSAYEQLGGTILPLAIASLKPFSTEAVAVVRIGSAPAGCPRGWPITGVVSQGPEGTTSHAPLVLEALDVAAGFGSPVYSTIEGTVAESFVNLGNPLDQRIGIVPSSCPGLNIVYFWHLSSRLVNVGDTVKPGKIIGASGTAGTGPHIHYQFNPSGNRSFPINEPPYIPQFVSRPCDSEVECGVTTTAP